LGNISTLGYALLCVLHKSPLTGYELVRRMSAPIGYYWSARQSQIYPELTRLAALGMIRSQAEHGPGPHQRMTHEITDSGRDTLAQWLIQPPAGRPPRDELVLKTYALAVADRAALRELYLAEAARREDVLEEYRSQEARLVQRGADRPDHADFGAYATVQLGLALEERYACWSRWLAEQLG
jgi:DNA-binding PadR family transcriptional regulator